MKRTSPRTVLLLLLATLGCSDAAGPVAPFDVPPSDATPDSAPIDGVDVRPRRDVAPPDAGDAPRADGDDGPPGGTTAAFDLASALTTAGTFWDLPWPSDLRLTAEGTPDLRGFPNPRSVPLIADLVAEAMQRRGFPQVPVAWFRFSAPLAPHEPDTALAAPGSTVLLLDVDPASPDRGARTPVVLKSLAADPYAPAWLLAVAPRMGFVLEPRRTYAVVVRRGLQDAEGGLLGVPPALHELSRGETPAGPRGEAAAALYAPLWETLDALGVPRGDVAAATVFTTGDVVGDLSAQSEAVLAAHEPALGDVALLPEGAGHERFCALTATITLPQFQRGEPPFDREGLFAETAMDALPDRQRDETAPVAITLPKRPMPAAGYPLLVYFHGSGGLSTQVIDRGPILAPGGERTPGQGPAHVVAAHGFAAAGPALPVNPERVPGADGRTYINPANLPAYRDTIRQGVHDMRLVVAALRRLEIPPEALAGCAGPALPAGAAAFRFDPAAVVAMGQSQGAIYANMVGALEPTFGAVVPTGSGGVWSHQLLVNRNAPIGGLIAVLLGTTEAKLSYLHPALHVLQTAWEPVETLVFLPRIGRAPLPGHPVRSVYQPAAEGDTYYPPPLYDALAIAFGHEQAGPVVWPSLQDALALAGLEGIRGYPVSRNVRARDGTAYTSAIVQFEGTGSPIRTRSSASSTP